MELGKTQQKYSYTKGFAEVGTEEWLKECEALLESVPQGFGTVLIAKERLAGLIERARELYALEQSGQNSTACPWCGA